MSASRIAPLAVALLLAASTGPGARIETLRWTHSDPANVASFAVYYGLSPAVYTTVIGVPPLQPDAQGIFTFDISVPDGATIYVAVTASDSLGTESGYSNEGTRGPAVSVPGMPGAPYVLPGL